MNEDASWAAEYRGVRVPASPFLHRKRIAQINAGAYERDEVAGALHVVREGDSVLELGAGIGVVGTVVAKLVRPRRLLSFEANPRLIPHIRTMYRLNGLAGIAEVRNEVLLGGQDRPGTVTFHLHASFLGSSLVGNSRSVEPVEVATADLGATLNAFRPDVMILDIEGGERDILRHADLSAVRAVVVEFHPDVYGVDGMEECKQMLGSAGLQRVEEASTRRVWTWQRPGQ
jgi:FkbM family methyltransferase